MATKSKVVVYYNVNGKTKQKTLPIQNVNHQLLEGDVGGNIPDRFSNNVEIRCEGGNKVYYIHTAIGTFCQKTDEPC